MPLLYAIDLSVSAADVKDDAYACSIEHIAQFVSSTTEALADDGTSQLASRTLASGQEVPPRTAEWHSLGAVDAKGLHVVIAQNSGDAVEFKTELSLTEIDGAVLMRVVLRRDFTDTWLKSVAPPVLFQPGLVRELGRDRRLVLKIANQVVDRRHVVIDSSPQVRELVTQLASRTRLPLFLLHARSDTGRKLALELPNRLMGLMRVVSLNYNASRALASQLPNTNIPFGGALLLWPGAGGPGLQFTGEEIEELALEGVRSRLMAALAPISAMARGTDTGWNTLRIRVEAERQRSTAERRHAARMNQNIAAERDASDDLLEQLRRSVKEWQELAEDADNRAQVALAGASEAQLAKDEARYWRGLYLTQDGDVEESHADLWAQVPPLISGEDPSKTFAAITLAATSRIAFTDRAARSWQEINYPDPMDMTDKLIALGRAANLLYDGLNKNLPRLGDWFKNEFALNVALTDRTIAQSKSMRQFEFENSTYEQIPHVKVRDGVKPNEVGRIHFALDSQNKRLIVNHVALKLYGI